MRPLPAGQGRTLLSAPWEERWQLGRVWRRARGLLETDSAASGGTRKAALPWLQHGVGQLWQPVCRRGVREQAEGLVLEMGSQIPVRENVRVFSSLEADLGC